MMVRSFTRLGALATPGGDLRRVQVQEIHPDAAAGHPDQRVGTAHYRTVGAMSPIDNVDNVNYPIGTVAG